MNKNKKETTNYIIFAFVIIIIIAFGFFWYFDQIQQKEEQEQEELEVPIVARFGSKIVYTTNTNTSTASFIAHCQSIGGAFNECGGPCAPDAESCVSVCAYTCEQISVDNRDKDGKDNIAQWQEFSDNQFNFSLKYPSDNWDMYKDISLDVEPKFNFYIKPDIGASLDLPLDHFANISHVSVYPRGVPTEGVFGRTKDLNFDVGFETANDSKVYLLEDGTAFAAYIRPLNPPQSWSMSGFIWMRLKINNLNTKCLRDGQEINFAQCDPVVKNDQIIRNGSVDKTAWERQENIVKTMKFEKGSKASDLIFFNNPVSGDIIESPLEIKGEARGTWYFEANFPIILTDWDGRIIAETYAQAQGGWMTEDFVPFTAMVKFESPYKEGDPDFMGNGFLILQKANPSGLSKNDDVLEIMVRFKRG